MESQDELIGILGSLDRIYIQNILMRISVREIAISIMHMNAESRQIVFSYLPEAKVRRIKDEIAYVQRLNISPASHSKVRDRVLLLLLSKDSHFVHKSYIKPGKK